MSRIIKHIISSSISNNNEPRRILYYPTGTHIDYEIISLPYLYYLTSNSDKLRQFPNVYYIPNIINEFLSVEFYCVIITEPFSQLEHARQISAQLHIPLVFLCSHQPKNIKPASFFLLNESLERHCLSICFSQETANNWLMSHYKIIESINNLGEVLDEWTKLYIRR